MNAISGNPRRNLHTFVVLLLTFVILPMLATGQTHRFTILHTSDEHSVLTPLPAIDYHPELPNPSMGGFARLSGLVKQIRAEKGNEPVLLLSSADYVGGSPFAWLILEGYSPEIELMQQIGYDATTVGNHEFDYGPDALMEYYRRAGYPEAHNQLPILIANLTIPDGHALNQATFLPHKIMKLDNGLTLGIFGLLGQTAYSVAPMAEPVTISDPVESARKQVKQLKEKGADLIIALSHSGVAEDHLLAEQVNNIDILLGGHDHYQTLEPIIKNNTIILHSSYYLKYLGMLELSYDTTTQTLELLNEANNTPWQIPLDASIPEDPSIKIKIDQYTKKLNDFVALFTDSSFTDVFAPILETEFPLKKHHPLVETTVGNFLTDAMRLEAENVTGERVHLAIQANGVIRGDIIPGTMEWSKNHVSFIDLVTIAGLGSGPDQKAGYPMVSLYLTAEEIYNVFEIASLLSILMGDTYFLQISGMKYEYDPGKATWLTIPAANIPVPAYRAVKGVWIYEGEGIQNEEGYQFLDRDSDGLFHLVADHYLTSFLPMVGEILPKLKLVLKDKEGNPLELDQSIIYENGYELKVWEALARYAVSLEKGSNGMPVIPDDYRAVQDRIMKTTGIPLYVWSYTGLAGVLTGLVLGIGWLVKKLRKRRS